MSYSDTIHINTLILDCDGVLTDGKKYVAENGDRQMIAFNSRDNVAVSALVEKGLRVIIVTASPWPGIAAYWKKYGCEVYYTKHKGNISTEIKEAGGRPINWSSALGVGDDFADVKLLEQCAKAYVPADAHPLLRQQFEELISRGGEGVVTELIYNQKL